MCLFSLVVFLVSVFWFLLFLCVWCSILFVNDLCSVLGLVYIFIIGIFIVSFLLLWLKIILCCICCFLMWMVCLLFLECVLLGLIICKNVVCVISVIKIKSSIEYISIKCYVIKVLVGFFFLFFIVVLLFVCFGWLVVLFLIVWLWFF